MENKDEIVEFYIEVENKDYGIIQSEVYKIEKEKFIELSTGIVNSKSKSIDFYNSDGEFVIIPEEVFKNSIIRLIPYSNEI